MIEKPSHLQLEALSALEHNSNFKHVKNWLEDSLMKTYQHCSTEHDDATLRQEQGAAQALSEFLTLANNARGIIEKNRR